MAAEATLPALIEACKKRITADRKRVFEERGKSLGAAAKEAHERSALVDALRLGRQPHQHRAHGDGDLGAGQDRIGRWFRTTPGRSACGISTSTISTSVARGGAGVGYGAPAATGAAVANKKYGRLSKMMATLCVPGVLWTQAHHSIPLLTVTHNRAYHQEAMHLQRMANRHQRDITTAEIGNDIKNTNIDYAALACSMGVHGEGPITDPKA